MVFFIKAPCQQTPTAPPNTTWAASADVPRFPSSKLRYILARTDVYSFCQTCCAYRPEPCCVFGQQTPNRPRTPQGGVFSSRLGYMMGVGLAVFEIMLSKYSANKLSTVFIYLWFQVDEIWFLSRLGPQSSFAIISCLDMGVKLSMSSPRAASTGLM